MFKRISRAIQNHKTSMRMNETQGVYTPRSKPAMVNKKEKKSIVQELKSIFKDFCDTTSMHGVARVYGRLEHRFNRRRWKNKFFCALVTICLIVSVFNIFNLLMDYYSYPTVTEISKLHEDSADFPAITFCNNNRNIKGEDKYIKVCTS